MARIPLIAGNWKMHFTVSEAATFAREIAGLSQGLSDREVMIAPPFTALSAVQEAVAGSSVLVAAQNVAWEHKGAFTGEISPDMLSDLGVHMVILGHSERRHIFRENNTLINKRLTGALRHGLSPVLCIGETLEQREAGKTFAVLEEQLLRGIAGVDDKAMEKVLLAYEPVWAIGTGKTASKEQAQEVHAFIRQIIAGHYEKTLAQEIRILYGGSVKPENVDSLMAQPDIDGALVGGAALTSESFGRIIHFI